MKHIRIIVLALLCLGLFSCEKRHIDDNLYGPSVCIINNGLQPVSMFDSEGKTRSFTIRTYCSGIEDANPNVRLVYNMSGVLDSYNQKNGTSYRLLPENCYKLDARHQVMEDKNVSFVVNFDCDKIAALAKDPFYADIQDYVIPYTLVSETEGVANAILEDVGNIFIKPELQAMTFEIEGPKSSEVRKDGEWYYMPFKMSTVVENKWSFAHSFEVKCSNQDGVEITESNYSVACISEAQSFTEGVSELEYELKLHSSLMVDASTWVNIHITSGTVDGENNFRASEVSEWKFEQYSILDCSDIPDSQLDWNTWNGGNGSRSDTHPRNIFNGKLDGGVWEGHNATNVPPAGGESYVNKGYTAPFVGIDFGREVDIHSLTVITPRASNWGQVRIGGFNFDWDKKLFQLSETEKANVTGTPGQWKFGLGNNQPSSFDAAKVDVARAALEAQLYEWCDEIFIWDLVLNKIATDRGGRTADNKISDERYKELHPIVVDRKTQYLQLIVLPGWWDFPTWNGINNGSIFQVAELEIVVNSPGVSRVK